MIFSIGLLLLWLGFLILRGSTPDIYIGINFTGGMAIGTALMLIGVTMMLVSIGILTWRYLP